MKVQIYDFDESDFHWKSILTQEPSVKTSRSTLNDIPYINSI